MKKALTNKFGSDSIKEMPVKEGEVPLILLDIHARTEVKVLMTNGLSQYQMPVPEKEAGTEYKELYFCLPSYWDLDDVDNPKMNWVFHWIQRLAKHVTKKETWYSHGHTMPCGKEKKQLSDSMKQNHFILLDPMFLENELAPIEVDGKKIHFLSIVPIFEDEFLFKYGKGTKKFLGRFTVKGNTEKLDDFRETVMRSRWRIFAKQ